MVIATPFYLLQAYAPYVASLAATLRACAAADLPVDYFCILGDSYVWRVRNSFAQMFLETNAKYLIFIDSDHAWTLEGFKNLLAAPEDVVAAAYPCKNNWNFWGVHHYIVDDGSQRPLVNPNTGLISAEWAPTGFMKISRNAFEQVMLSEPENTYIDDKGKCHGFFNHIVENGTAYGEDISFCLRLQRAGVKLWIEPNITIEHYGVMPYKGNYADFLRRQPGGDLYDAP